MNIWNGLLLKHTEGKHVYFNLDKYTVMMLQIMLMKTRIKLQWNCHKGHIYYYILCILLHTTE